MLFNYLNIIKRKIFIYNYKFDQNLIDDNKIFKFMSAVCENNT